MNLMRIMISLELQVIQCKIQTLLLILCSAGIVSPLDS
jgi:hypothetical protein